MGRGAGDIALNAAIAAGATACVIPEFPYDADEICAKINKARKLGKRNFIVIVSEGVGSEYAPALAKKIEADTGVETKFARFAHIVRGGNPNLRDRVMASAMGMFAVNELLAGNSNLVICQRNGDIESVDINFALILDRMYKGKLKDGDLEVFSAEEVEKMKALAKERRAELEVLYRVATTINL
jgi:6-phosphofructokinase 1